LPVFSRSIAPLALIGDEPLSSSLAPLGEASANAPPADAARDVGITANAAAAPNPPNTVRREMRRADPSARDSFRLCSPAVPSLELIINVLASSLFDFPGI
jgi:hypothetical protein